MYLQLIKFFLPKTVEDDWFLFMLGVVQVLVGTVISQSDLVGTVLFAWALGLGEVGSGLLTALGLLGPVGPALMISIMLVAAVVGHAGKGFFATGGGYELPVIYSAGALALAFSGAGALSLDALLGLERLWTPAASWIAIAAGIVLAIVNLAVRRLPKPDTAVTA